MMSNMTLGGHHARWALQLQPYSFNIIHRPGKIHQNEDIASRHPLPSTADSSDARLDEKDQPDPQAPTVISNPAATTPAIHTTPSTTAAGPPKYDYSTLPTSIGPHIALGTPQFLSINTTPLPGIHGLNLLTDISICSPPPITLYEPFGGVCSGLEAALLAGLHVQQYIYSDPDPAAQAVAALRLTYLHIVFPAQLPHSASNNTFSTLPHDVDNITNLHLIRTFARDPRPLLIIAGWECQDLSPAGPNTGLHGSRSNTFFSLLQLVATTQTIRPNMPTAYIIENVATTYHFNPNIRHHHITITNALGQPTTSDAAACGAASHRLRHLWTSMAPTPALQDAIYHSYPHSRKPPDSRADSILFRVLEDWL
ncbi:hypothetical protein DUNSADRAFT_13852 [Dunaliella salina]|uniref:Uncharacterized protein n=1 Tax=Dunaliella salina TaxID=3046 RepID=A0ABQ7G8I4_DUNSA|nr:hypothetical protein DUNSADRAFT_13852 [Dunaliella salina]|eukprot:KAF5830920.1 hypothetical protein DUNSADRAFT_13852 [Dunaliella salina]